MVYSHVLAPNVDLWEEAAHHREEQALQCTGPELHQKWQSLKTQNELKEWINPNNPGFYPKQRQFAEIQHSVCWCVVSMTKYSVST